MMRCKAVMEIVFTVVGPPPKPNPTNMAVPDTHLQTYLSIR